MFHSSHSPLNGLYDREEHFIQSQEGEIGQRAMAFLHHCYMSLSTSSLPSTSTFTMSNIPGAGRTIDKFIYSKGGRLLQSVMDRFAHRMGMGPIATAQRIEKLLESRRVQKLYMIFMEEPLPGFRESGADEEDIGLISKECLKLVHYALTDIESNQILAMWCIKDLIIRHPGLSHCLSDPDVVSQLVSLNQDISQFTLLLSSAISYIQNRDRERSRVFDMLDEEGLGPSAIVERINESLQKQRLHKLHTLVMGFNLDSNGKHREVANEIDENCRELVSYLQTENTPSQVKVLQQIQQLATDHLGLDCYFYKYLDVFRALSTKAASDRILKGELKRTMACISDRDSAHALKFVELLQQEGYGPIAISECIQTDLTNDTVEILFTLLVGCDLVGSQSFRRDVKAIENNCDRLMAYVAMSKSHSLQNLVLNQIDMLVEKYRGLSCCFKTLSNMRIFVELAERNGSLIKPRIMKTMKCIIDNNLDDDLSLRRMFETQGYSEDTILPFLRTARLRSVLKENTRDKVLALIRDLSDVYPSEGFKEDIAKIRDSCAELMNLITSRSKILIQVLALKSLEQILFEYPDFGFYLVKEYHNTIKAWQRKAYESAPTVGRLAHSIADSLAPKMTLLSMKDWTNSLFIDHLFVSATDFYYTPGSRQVKGHIRWDSNTSTLGSTSTSFLSPPLLDKGYAIS